MILLFFLKFGPFKCLNNNSSPTFDLSSSSLFIDYRILSNIFPAFIRNFVLLSSEPGRDVFKPKSLHIASKSGINLTFKSTSFDKCPCNYLILSSFSPRMTDAFSLILLMAISISSLLSCIIVCTSEDLC